MNAAIEDIIRQKPHLADPFRFYEKTARFVESVRGLPVAQGLGQTAYAPQVIDGIFERFSTFLELPEGSMDPLKHAMELGEIDFTRLPLGEIPAFSLPYPEDDLAMLLFLISRPYFYLLGEARRMDGAIWEEGRCPVCNARPALTRVRDDDGRRRVFCSFCGTEGYLHSAGCPTCRTLDGAGQNILAFEGEEGFTIHTCDLCHSYVKTVEGSMLAGLSAEIVDLMSLPLDIVAQEKGFVRRSPNPIGMRTMSMRG